jgi:beta-galactosidase
MAAARVLKSGSAKVTKAAEYHELVLESLGTIELWDLKRPRLYTVVVKLAGDDGSIDEYKTRIGFREAKFTPQGFLLNGQHVKIRGLNRHQTYPYVGGAMPAE